MSKEGDSSRKPGRAADGDLEAPSTCCQHPAPGFPLGTAHVEAAFSSIYLAVAKDPCGLVGRVTRCATEPDPDVTFDTSQLCDLEPLIFPYLPLEYRVSCIVVRFKNDLWTWPAQCLSLGSAS